MYSEGTRPKKNLLTEKTILIIIKTNLHIRIYFKRPAIVVLKVVHSKM